MFIYGIDIPKSRQTEKLVFKKSLIEKILDTLFLSIFVLPFPFVSGMVLYLDISKNQSINLLLLYFILSLILSSLLIYSIINLNTLKRIKGLSRGKNSSLIKKIAKNNNWNNFSTNQQITTINFSWKEALTDWGKQLTILYDGNDILVNCTSFGLHLNPSPFHWFANRRKVNKLKTEFKNGISKILQQQTNQQLNIF